MGEAYFYHLTRQPTDDALVPLLTRCLQNDWRVVVRGVDAKQLEWLDEKLWLGDKAEFLPHGIAGGDHDADQPVLLSTGTSGPPHDCLICIEGAPVTKDEVEAATRVCILFQDADAGQMATARAQWSALTNDGVAAQYHSQASGKWELKAKKP